MSGRTATRGRHRTDHSTPSGSTAKLHMGPSEGAQNSGFHAEAQSACPSRDACHRTVTRCCVVAVTQLRGVRATGPDSLELGNRVASLRGSGPFASRAVTLSESACRALTLRPRIHPTRRARSTGVKRCGAPHSCWGASSPRPSSRGYWRGARGDATPARSRPSSWSSSPRSPTTSSRDRHAGSARRGRTPVRRRDAGGGIRRP